MGYTGKGIAFILILTVAFSFLSLLIVKPAFAQTPIPTSYPTAFSPSLSIPEFTIQLADHSYDVPPTTTTSTDPYTGKQTVTTQPGYHVENKTIDFNIINQPHISTPSSNYYGIDLYYDIRFKGHFGDTWTELHTYNEEENVLPTATNSQYTLISVPYTLLSIPENYSSDAQIDFQIRAINGTSHPLSGVNSPFGYWTYESSAWSNIETISIPDGSVSVSASVTPVPPPTLTPTSTSAPSPTIPEFQGSIILSLFAVIPLIFTLLLRKKTSLKRLITRCNHT